MYLNESLLNDCEEFFELIVNEQDCEKLDRAIESLRNVLERDIDGWTSYEDEKLARIVQCRMMEIWSLIPKSEKTADPNLSDYYENIISQVEEASGYETDDYEDEEE